MANPRRSGPKWPKKEEAPKLGRTEIRQQKRKRDQDDLQSLQQRVDEFVCPGVPLCTTTLTDMVNCRM